MQQETGSARGRTAAQQINTATVTAGGLYLATHSVAVTAIGTIAWAMMAGWSMWLDRHQKRDPEIPGISSAE